MHNYIWYGHFSSYAEAQIEASRLNAPSINESEDGFNSKIWQEKQIIMFQKALNGEYVRNTNIETALLDLEVDSVIDFGGGSGWIFALLQNKPELKGIKYFNVELASTKVAFERVIKKSNMYQWIDLDDSGPNVGQNMIYSNSAIQYLSDNKILMDLAMRYKPSVVLLDDVFESSNRDTFSLQNYYNFYQVNRFISVDLLEEQMQSLGYQLKEKIPYINTYNKKMIAEILLPNGSTLTKPTTTSLKFTKIVFPKSNS